ncbi:MAG TPA: sodium:solute symporter [Phycisphaerae bacterium]|nr:sodium:solute symporter [Phycisphaerae bacterium]
MNMHLIDWAIVAGLIAILAAAALQTKKHSGSVAAFLAADRCGGRYLISVAFGMSQLGVITLVGYFELNYDVGYTSIWWPLMEGPAWIIMGLTGWVIYRYRQTRAMTLAQFFEMRYSRNFRVFAGVVAYLSGIINFGIFPAISAHFFIALCGLPDHFRLAGLTVSTFAALMLLLIGIALFFTFVGGQIAVMVTDFLQGAFANITFIILIIFLLTTFRWERISQALLAAPPEKSMVHPFHLGQEGQFNFWYYLIGVFIMFYTMMAWQGTQGYNCAAKTPHEAKMANILNGWRWRVLMLIILIVPICARTVMNHPDFAAQAATVNSRLAAVEGRTVQETETLRNQLRSPLAMAVMFPSGLLGLACAAALAAHIGTHGAYLHSWGSIFIQDVILPFRRKPLTPQQHLRLLKLSICGVALFIFLFSLLFPLGQYIVMFCDLTAAVFVGGAGSVIIGGLYWKRGTTAGAWAAILTGMGLSLAGIIIKQHDPKFWLTGRELSFWAMVLAIAAYILVSLLGPRAVFNMDKLLHRGAYAVADDTTALADVGRVSPATPTPADVGRVPPAPPTQHWWEKLGFTREFTGADRWITYITLGWPLVWTVIFIAGTAYNLAVDVPETSWLSFWHGWTWFILAGAIIVTTWFTIGGIRDLRELFRLLRLRRAAPTDDGRVET